MHIWYMLHILLECLIGAIYVMKYHIRHISFRVMSHNLEIHLGRLRFTVVATNEVPKLLFQCFVCFLFFINYFLRIRSNSYLKKKKSILKINIMFYLRF